MPLSDLANISISTSGAGLGLPGFGVALILGAYSKTWPERVRTYSSLVAGVDADFAAGTPEYLAAAALFGQNPRPDAVMIGRGTRKPTQVFKVYIPADGSLAQQVTTFVVTVGGVDYTFTSDATPTQAEVTTGVAAALSAGTGTHGLTVTSVAGTITMTGAVGAWQRVCLKENAPGVTILGLEETTADPGVASDLGEIATENGQFYAVTLIHKSKAIMSAAAPWVEASERLLAFASQESTIITAAVGGATDAAATAKTAAYARTAVMYDPDNGVFADAAILGRCLPETPGTETWANKTLAGVPARNLTATHLVNLRAKNAGWVYSIGGRNLTEEGKVAAGEWIDTVRGRDALKVDMQGRVVTRIADAKKIPYTDRGAAILHGEILASLRSFEPGGTNATKEAGLIAEGSSFVIMPRVSAQSVVDRGARYFPGVQFGGDLAGAIHKLKAAGTLTA